MPQTYCCVPMCKNRGGHRFPKEKKLCKEWMVAVRREKNGDWSGPATSLVCYDHFSPDAYITVTAHGTVPLKKTLKPGAVPSLFPWTLADSEAASQRKERRANREKNKSSPEIDNLHETDLYEEEVEEMDTDEMDDKEEITEPVMETASSCTQTPAFCPNSIEAYVNNDEAIQYFTGCDNYEHFLLVLNVLGPAAHQLQYRWYNVSNDVFSVENQLFMTLMKLRTAMPNKQLALMFNISETSVSNIFVTWVNFLYYELGEIPIWPERDLVNFYMPVDFRNKYPSTRIILDGMEIPIKKPKKVDAQQATYSTYKSRNTLKCVVGVSPSGMVTHIPPAYGGSSSDRSLVEKSDLTRKCDPKDSIMVDKGFNVQDMFAPYDITVNIPTFLKQTNQFSPKQLADDRKIASKRVHVERIIGLAKTYKILTVPLSEALIVLGSEIVFVCFMLCNFRRCIVSKYA